MMNGYYSGGWMWGGWMMIIGGLVFLAIIAAVVWLVIRSQKNQQTPPLSSLPQQPYPAQRNGQDSSPSVQPSPEMYQEGEKQYTYPQAQYPQQERPPLD